MTTEQNSSSGTSSDFSGGDQQGGHAEDKVSYETHRKLLGEKKKLQEEAQALKVALEEKNRKERDQQEAEMKQKEEWKKISELKEQELKETKLKLDEFQQGIRNSKKASAFLGELAKRGVSIRNSYYDLIDVEKIIVNPGTEEIEPDSVKKYADLWITEHYELAKASNPNTKMPDKAPQGSSQLTYDEWKQLPLAEMKKRYKDVRSGEAN